MPDTPSDNQDLEPAGESTLVTRWVIDLDGVVWRGQSPIEGSIEAIERLRVAGHEVIFVTNHAESPAIKQRRLAEMGVVQPLVITSAEAAAHLCGHGRRAFVLGEPTLSEVLTSAGIDAIDVASVDPDGPVPQTDVVIVGACSDWNRSRTGLIADAVRAGAEFIATNSDPTYPQMGVDGPRLLPGAGALIAAVEVTSGVKPTFAGKPNQPAADLVLQRYGPVDFVVGDRDDTDGEFARRLGARFALVLSGGTPHDEVPTDPAPDLLARDLACVVDEVLRSSSTMTVE